MYEEIIKPQVELYNDIVVKDSNVYTFKNLHKCVLDLSEITFKNNFNDMYIPNTLRIMSVSVTWVDDENIVYRCPITEDWTNWLKTIGNRKIQLSNGERTKRLYVEITDIVGNTFSLVIELYIDLLTLDEYNLSLSISNIVNGSKETAVVSASKLDNSVESILNNGAISVVELS